MGPIWARFTGPSGHYFNLCGTGPECWCAGCERTLCAHVNAWESQPLGRSFNLDNKKQAGGAIESFPRSRDTDNGIFRKIPEENDRTPPKRSWHNKRVHPVLWWGPCAFQLMVCVYVLLDMTNPASANNRGRVCLSGCELILYEGSVRYGFASEVALLHVPLRFDRERLTDRPPGPNAAEENAVKETQGSDRPS